MSDPNLTPEPEPEKMKSFRLSKAPQAQEQKSIPPSSKAIGWILTASILWEFVLPGLL